ncbi:MAG TPA: PRC-barrel domain-containing protein [Planctomycetota bacterium]|nr:PRC-barrel domain-containing protein [Planctomycetota bacterium]
MKARPLLLAAALACAGGFAVAQQEAAPDAAAAAVPADDLVVSDALLGAPVQSDAGMTLGTVDDALVDATSGRLLSVVLSPAPSLRADGQLVALPPESVELAPAADAAAGPRNVRLRGVTEDQLRAAPGFARDRWPDAADSSWLARMRAHFGGNAPSDGASPQPERLSTLAGREVQDSQSAAVGRVAEVAVDLREREVALALVDTAPDLGPADRQMAVPYAALRATDAGDAGRAAARDGAASRQAFALGLSRERLAGAPRVDRGDLPRLFALARSGEANTFFGVQARHGARRAQPPVRARPERDRPERPRGSQGGPRGGGGPRGP